MKHKTIKEKVLDAFKKEKIAITKPVIELDPTIPESKQRWLRG